MFKKAFHEALKRFYAVPRSFYGVSRRFYGVSSSFTKFLEGFMKFPEASTKIPWYSIKFHSIYMERDRRAGRNDDLIRKHSKKSILIIIKKPGLASYHHLSPGSFCYRKMSCQRFHLMRRTSTLCLFFKSFLSIPLYYFYFSDFWFTQHK